MQVESAPYSYTFDNLAQPVTVQIYLYEKISNPLQIIELLNNKNANYAFLNANMIVSLKEILIGLNRIYTQQENLTNKSLIFYLSPESSKVIFQQVRDTETSLQKCLFQAAEIEQFKVFDYNQPSILVLQKQNEGCNIFDELESNVKGNELPISQIGSFINIEHLKKIYSITDQEANLDTDIRESEMKRSKYSSYTEYLSLLRAQMSLPYKMKGKNKMHIYKDIKLQTVHNRD